MFGEGPYPTLRSPPFTLPSLRGINLAALTSSPTPTRSRQFSSVADSSPNGWSRSWGWIVRYVIRRSTMTRDLEHIEWRFTSLCCPFPPTSPPVSGSDTSATISTFYALCVSLSLGSNP